MMAMVLIPCHSNGLHASHYFVLLTPAGFSVAMLWVRRLASAPGVSLDERIAIWAAFYAELWPPFWRRELDIENPEASTTLCPLLHFCWNSEPVSFST